MSFWRWFLLSIVLGPLAYTLVIFSITAASVGWRAFADESFWVITAGGWLGVNLLLTPALLAYVRIWTVVVTPTSLSGSNAWGVFATVSWESIHTVKPSRVPFLPAVRVFSSEANLVIWLPLFLVNYPQFARRVAEYAGPEHPLTPHVLSRLDPEED